MIKELPSVTVYPEQSKRTLEMVGFASLSEFQNFLTVAAASASKLEK